MDTVRRIVRGNQKGMMIVYVALAIVALCAFVALAVDMGYMYVAKGQLQNAADAAALAGASQLPDTGKARAEAVTFAAKNVAAGSAINISSSGGNALTPDNDITVGNWNPEKYPANPYDENRLPVNAVKVRARRTGAADAAGTSIDGPVDLFFAKIFDKTQMGASSSAIAQRPVRAGFYFAIGQAVCNSASFPVELTPQSGGGSGGNMGWSSLLQQETPASDVLDNFMCPPDKVPDVDVCAKPKDSIFTTGGTDATVFQGVETDFYDPNYDRINKTFSGGQVATWTAAPVALVWATNASGSAMPQAATKIRNASAGSI